MDGMGEVFFASLETRRSLYDSSPADVETRVKLTNGNAAFERKLYEIPRHHHIVHMLAGDGHPNYRDLWPSSLGILDIDPRRITSSRLQKPPTIACP